MLLSVLQCMRQPPKPPIGNRLAPNITSAEAEKPWTRSKCAENSAEFTHSLGALENLIRRFQK